MCSQGAKVDYRHRGGPSNFCVNGVIFHLMGPAIPDPLHRPAFAQLYIIDSQLALQQRLEIMNGQNSNNSSRLRESILALLQQTLERINPYVHSLRQFARPIARDIQEAATRGLPPPTLPNYSLDLIAPTGQDDARRYNLPATDTEIAAFIPESVSRGPTDVPPYNRDIRVETINGDLQFLDNLSPHIEPLRYPLLFPTSAPGYGLGMEYHRPPGMTIAQWARRKYKEVSMRSYAAYRLMTRGFDKSLFFQNGRLFQEWVIDMYGRVENARLSYIRTHQHELRTTQYRGLADAVDRGDHH